MALLNSAIHLKSIDIGYINSDALLINFLRKLPALGLLQSLFPIPMKYTFAQFPPPYWYFRSPLRILVCTVKTSNTIEYGERTECSLSIPPCHYNPKRLLGLIICYAYRIRGFTQRWSCKDKGSEIIFLLEKPFYRVFHLFAN